MRDALRFSLVVWLGLVSFDSVAQNAPSAKLKPIEVKVPNRKERVSYAREVAEVLEDKCVGCHSAILAENRLNLEAIAGMLKGGKRGPAVVAGKADESLLFKMAAHRVEPVMPPKDKPENKPMTADELGLLKLWIDAGAKDDSATESKPRESKTVVLGDLPAGFQPINAVDFRTMTGHQGPVRSVAFSPRGDRLATADALGGMKVWETANGRGVIAFGHTAPNGAAPQPIQKVKFTDKGGLVSASADSTLKTWAFTGSWAEHKTLGSHGSRMLALDFSPDGKFLATGGGEPTRSGELKVWEVGKGLLARSLETLHSDTVFAVRFSPDGTKLASASADKFLKVTSVNDGKLLRSFEGHSHHVMAVDWKSDGKQLVSGGADSVIKVWDFDSGEQVRTLQAVGKQITAVRWNAAKPEVVGASGDARVRTRDPDSGGVARTFSGPGDHVYCVAASADGTRIAAGGADSVLFVWNGKNGQVIRKIEPPSSSAASARLPPCGTFVDRADADADADDYVNLKRLESELRNRSKRPAAARCRWIGLPWRTSAHGNLWTKVQGHHVVNFPSRFSEGYCYGIDGRFHRGTFPLSGTPRWRAATGFSNWKANDRGLRRAPWSDEVLRHGGQGQLAPGIVQSATFKPGTLAKSEGVLLSRVAS